MSEHDAALCRRFLPGWDGTIPPDWTARELVLLALGIARHLARHGHDWGVRAAAKRALKEWAA